MKYGREHEFPTVTPCYLKRKNLEKSNRSSFGQRLVKTTVLYYKLYTYSLHTCTNMNACICFHIQVK